MNERGRGQEKNPGCGTEKEWEGIIDKIEAAIVMSLANKVLENAAVREESIEESRQEMKLVELRGFSRKKRLNLPSRKAS